MRGFLLLTWFTAMTNQSIKGRQILVMLFCLALCACSKVPPPSQDIPVSGRVSDEEGNGVGAVMLYIDYGNRPGNGGLFPMGGNDYGDYDDSITTNSNGQYSYLLDYEKGDAKRICCKLPSSFSSVNRECSEVNLYIDNAAVVPQVVNFVLKK
jgi:hypothetical protein